MGALPPELLKAIDPAVRQVRRALRELEASELPASLRKVAATEGGRLPPPLMAKLLTELDSNEWLRRRLGEKLGDRIDPATEAFLARGDDWWIDVVGASIEAARARPPEPAVDEASALRDKLAVARGRLEEAEAERERLRGELRTSRSELARRHDEERKEVELEALRAENRRLDAALGAEASQRHLAEQRVADLKRRSRTTVAGPGPPAHPRPRTVGMGDPAEVGRRLDTEIAALAAAVPSPAASAAEPLPAPPPQPATALRLPQGIAPDRPEAVRWVLDRADPVRLVVDGYNVTYLVDPTDFHGGAARRRLVSLLGRLASRRPHPVVVVFDSAQPPGSPGRVGDVEIVFTSGEKADDRIVDLARASELPVAVVTNDRELRDRAEEVGALTVWADGLVPLLG